MPYGGRLDPPDGPPACDAGWTYTPPRIRAFGRMKRIACGMSPAKTSSAVNSMAAMGKPPASVEVHWSPRKPGGYDRVRSQNRPQRATSVLPDAVALYIS